MAEIISGNLIATKKKFGIVVSRFNEFISKSLLEGALDTLTRHGADDKDIKIVWVPGAFEISYAAGQLMKANKFDAIICLGTVIRGDTPHFDYICKAVSDGVMKLNLSLPVPTIFGVLTVDNEQQARERIGGKNGHKGEEAAITALKMIPLSPKGELRSRKFSKK